jgi:predicted nucleic acid-binding protein
VILVDTGPIVAVINDRDDHHQEYKYLLERLPGPLLIPATVATEVCLMVERRRGTYAELAFLSDVPTHSDDHYLEFFLPWLHHRRHRRQPRTGVLDSPTTSTGLSSTFPNACAQPTLNCSSPKLATISRSPPRAVT